MRLDFPPFSVEERRRRRLHFSVYISLVVEAGLLRAQRAVLHGLLCAELRPRGVDVQVGPLVLLAPRLAGLRPPAVLLHHGGRYFVGYLKFFLLNFFIMWWSVFCQKLCLHLVVYSKFSLLNFIILWLTVFSQKLHLRLVLFRFFWVYGAWRRPDGQLTASRSETWFGLSLADAVPPGRRAGLRRLQRRGT